MGIIGAILGAAYHTPQILLFNYEKPESQVFFFFLFDR